MLGCVALRRLRLNPATAMTPFVTTPRIAVFTGLGMEIILAACCLRRNVYTDNMPRNDNSVNMNAQGRNYHHGDLRAALIEEGLAQISNSPAEKVSLRKIARNVGVSATAVYRHFPNKAALLGALCGVGSVKLSDTFRDALSKTPAGIDAFEIMGRTYVRFAIDNPSMLSNSLGDVLPKDTPPELQMVKRLQAWSIVHGLSMLILDGQLPDDEKMIAAVVSRSFL